MAKPTLKQRLKALEASYNMQYNSIFKLHKYLVEAKDSPHSIQFGDPIDDAIALLEKRK